MSTICLQRGLSTAVETANQLGNVPRRQWPAEEIALHLLDFGMRHHRIELIFGLDTFGNDRQVEIAPQLGNIGQ